MVKPYCVSVVIMSYYFVIIGPTSDNPLYEIEIIVRKDNVGKTSDDQIHLKQFISHSALDCIEESMSQQSTNFFKNIDKFNEYVVSAFVTYGGCKFILVHDDKLRSEEVVRSFFNEVYELFVRIILNPFFDYKAGFHCPAFNRHVLAIAKHCF